MGNITLKEYFKKLDEYKGSIDEEINEIFDLEIQQFTYDTIRLIEARVSDGRLFVKLEIVNYDKTNKNYLVEIFKIKNQIHQVIYIKRPLGMGIDVEKKQISLNTTIELIEFIESQSDYFNNPCSKNNILSLFKISHPTDEVLEQIEFDIDKFPSFIFGIRKKVSHL